MRKVGIRGVVGCISQLLPLLIRAQSSLPPEVAAHGFADLVVVHGKVVSMDDAGVNENPGRIYEAMAVKKEDHRFGNEPANRVSHKLLACWNRKQFLWGPGCKPLHLEGSSEEPVGPFPWLVSDWVFFATDQFCVPSS